MLEILTNENAQLLIAIPIALLIFQKTDIYKAIMYALIFFCQAFISIFIFIQRDIQKDLSYFSPSKKRQQPIKNANKVGGWLCIIIFSFFTAYLFILSTTALFMLAYEGFLAFLIGAIFFTICILIGRWFTACAYKAAWQNGINIQVMAKR